MHYIYCAKASLVAQMVKNLLKSWVKSLGWEDPLEKGVATHSSILAWIIPCTEEPGGLQFIGLQRARGNDCSNFASLISIIIISAKEEGNFHFIYFNYYYISERGE